MKTQLIKICGICLLAFASAHYALAQPTSNAAPSEAEKEAAYINAATNGEWNPDLTEARKAAFAKALQENAAEQWKHRYDGIHAVISLGMPSNLPSTRYNFATGVVGYTNILFYKPLPFQALDVHLYNNSGKEVPKTTYGSKYGQPLKPDKELVEGPSPPYFPDEVYGSQIRELHFEITRGNPGYWNLDALKSFRIKEAGEYRLQVQVRLFTKDTNGVFQPFILPPVETKVSISESDLGK
jgi:hypothetical protein